jgi:hypothetical protein
MNMAAAIYACVDAAGMFVTAIVNSTEYQSLLERAPDCHESQPKTKILAILPSPCLLRRLPLNYQT